MCQHVVENAGLMILLPASVWEQETKHFLASAVSQVVQTCKISRAWFYRVGYKNQSSWSTADYASGFTGT